jgi:hypothetical protein
MPETNQLYSYINVNQFDWQLNQNLYNKLNQQFSESHYAAYKHRGRGVANFLSDKVASLTPTASQPHAPAHTYEADSQLSALFDQLQRCARQSEFWHSHIPFSQLLFIILNASDDQLVTKALLTLYEISVKANQPLTTHQDAIDQWTDFCFSKLESAADSNIWVLLGCYLSLSRLISQGTLRNQFDILLKRRESRSDSVFLIAQILEYAKHDDLIFEVVSPRFEALKQNADPYIQIRLIELLAKNPSLPATHTLMRDFLHVGHAAQVRFAAARALLSHFLTLHDAEQTQLNDALLILQEDPSDYVLSGVATKVIAILEQTIVAVKSLNLVPPPFYATGLIDFFQGLRAHKKEGLRRLGSLGLQWLALIRSSELIRLYQQIIGPVTEDNKPVLLPFSMFNHETSADIWFCFSLIAHNRLGFDVARRRSGYMIRKGHHFSFRFWRLYHELTHPSASKRQGFAHWVGRSFHGSIQIPSSITCELVTTGIPGEPLWLEEAGGYRPWVPLACQAYQLLGWKTSPQISLYTLEGVTRIRRPQGWKKRLKAWVYFSLHYAKIANLRNWTNDCHFPANHYVQKLRELGFEISFQTRGRFFTEDDPTVTRYFEESPWS